MPKKPLTTTGSSRPGSRSHPKTSPPQQRSATPTETTLAIRGLPLGNGSPPRPGTSGSNSSSTSTIRPGSSTSAGSASLQSCGCYMGEDNICFLHCVDDGLEPFKGLDAVSDETDKASSYSNIILPRYAADIHIDFWIQRGKAIIQKFEEKLKFHIMHRDYSNHYPRLEADMVNFTQTFILSSIHKALAYNIGHKNREPSGHVTCRLQNSVSDFLVRSEVSQNSLRSDTTYHIVRKESILKPSVGQVATTLEQFGVLEYKRPGRVRIAEWDKLTAIPQADRKKPEKHEGRDLNKALLTEDQFAGSDAARMVARQLSSYLIRERKEGCTKSTAVGFIWDGITLVVVFAQFLVEQDGPDEFYRMEFAITTTKDRKKIPLVMLGALDFAYEMRISGVVDRQLEREILRWTRGDR